MRCLCCNKNLNDWESTAKDADGNYLDTCNGCIEEQGIPAVGRADLERFAEAPNDDEDWDDDLLYDDEE